MPDSDAQEQTGELHDLGPGAGSKVERIKVESDYLRGQIAEELAQGTSRFSEAQVQLIKFHGMYQQVNRDVRPNAIMAIAKTASTPVTGCPNGCARPYMGDIGFVGRTKDVYNVYTGGDRPNTRMNTLYAPSVHLNNLAATIRPLLILWKVERAGLESFGDFCNRVGIPYLQEHMQAHV